MTFRLSQIRFASIAFTTAAVCLVFLLHTSIAAEPERPTAVIIRLTSDGRIQFQGESVSLSRLAATIRAADIRRSQLILRADRQVPYSMIVAVLDALGLGYSSPILYAPGPAYR